MTITIFGATGMVGKHVIEQALAKGHKVIAFGRNIEKLIDADLNNDNLVASKGYVFDEKDVYNAVKNTDAVISVLGGAFDGTDKTRSLGLKNIINQMQKAGVTRIIALGGMGVLQADEETLIIDTPDYPQQYMAVGQEHLQAFKQLQSSMLNWTFVCPPNIIDKAVDESYITLANYHPGNGKQEISAGNIADFMLKEISNNQFALARVGIVNS